MSRDKDEILEKLQKSKENISRAISELLSKRDGLEPLVKKLTS